jgi:YHS domain-containing protein
LNLEETRAEEHPLRHTLPASLFLAAALAASGCGRGKEAPSPAPMPESEERDPSAVNTERDPVCGMFVNPKTAPKSEFEGKTYYFCSLEDKAKFDQDPGAYSSQAP